MNIFLLLLIGWFCACYIPRGAFISKPINSIKASNDSIFIALPTEFQVYNYFKVTYVKNKEVYRAVKQNDSTIVFIARKEVEMSQEAAYRVEVGIVPFFEN